MHLKCYCIARQAVGKQPGDGQRPALAGDACKVVLHCPHKVLAGSAVFRAAAVGVVGPGAQQCMC